LGAHTHASVAGTRADDWLLPPLLARQHRPVPERAVRQSASVFYRNKGFGKERARQTCLRECKWHCDNKHGMNSLPVELVDLLIKQTDGLTVPILRCVCTQWCALVDAYLGVQLSKRAKRANQRPAGAYRSYKHVCCLSSRRCAVHYAHFLVDKRRWSVLEWMLLHRLLGPFDGLNTVDKHACAHAAWDGDQPRLNEMLTQRGYRWDERLCKRAALGGHLHILQYLHAMHHSCYMWATSVYINAAAKGGHIRAIAWLHERARVPDAGGACTKAALHGHFDTIKWLHARGYKLTERTCAAAARCGRLDILQWAKDQGCPWDVDVACEAAKGGHLDVLQWTRTNGCPWDGSVLSHAAQGGHFEVLKWAHLNGCGWDIWVCDNAAKVGRIDMLEWCLANGCGWDSHVYIEAIRHGHIDVVKWAHAHGCPWGEYVCREAVERGDLGLLRWLTDNGCSWNWLADAAAARRGHLGMVQWAKDRGYSVDMKTICECASAGGHIAMLQWVIDQGHALNGEKCLSLAAECGRLSLTKWLVECLKCRWTKAHLSAARRGGFTEIEEWACARGHI